MFTPRRSKLLVSVVLLISGLLSACKRSEPVEPRLPAICIYPVEPGCEIDARCLRLETAPVCFRDYRFEAQEGQKPSILLKLSDETARDLSDLSLKYLGGQLAVEIGGTLVHAPKVRVPLEGSRLELSFCSRPRYEAILKALHAPISRGDESDSLVGW